MSLRPDESLENLRRSATCAICSQFYNKPKKLPNCPHTLCLKCLEQLMLHMLHINYPPCPMCRTPIVMPLCEVHKFDPAIEAQNIVDFVKRFETCGLCELKSNPNLKCLECNAFVPIIPSSNSCTVPRKVIRTCQDHDDQPLDLFCIICRRTLCIRCKEYSRDDPLMS